MQQLSITGKEGEGALMVPDDVWTSRMNWGVSRSSTSFASKSSPTNANALLVGGPQTLGAPVGVPLGAPSAGDIGEAAAQQTHPGRESPEAQLNSVGW